MTAKPEVFPELLTDWRHYRPIAARFEGREILHVARPIRLNCRQTDCSAIGGECKFSFAPLPRSTDSRYQKPALNLARVSTRPSCLSNGRPALKHEVRSPCLNVRNPAEK